MEFLSVRELSSASRETWEKLRREGELTITNNGKPTAIMLDVSGRNFDETLTLIRQVKTMRLLNNIWAEAAERGPISDEEIEAEIRAVRMAHAEKAP
jgi:hypothetical protein